MGRPASSRGVVSQSVLIRNIEPTYKTFRRGTPVRRESFLRITITAVTFDTCLALVLTIVLVGSSWAVASPTGHGEAESHDDPVNHNE